MSFLELVRLAEARLSSGSQARGSFAQFVLLGEELAEFFASRHDAVAVLRSYLELAQLDGVVGGSSHRHPNGFEKLSLYRSTATDVRIRLHFWEDSARSEMSSIHDHRWHFASVVVAGLMKVTNFVQSNGAGLEYSCAQLSDISERNEKTIRLLGKRRLESTASYVLRAGDAHALHADVPHRVVAWGARASATIVVTGEPLRACSHSYREHELRTSVRAYDVLPKSSMLERLERVTARLEAEGKDT